MRKGQNLRAVIRPAGEPEQDRPIDIEELAERVRDGNRMDAEYRSNTLHTLDQRVRETGQVCTMATKVVEAKAAALKTAVEQWQEAKANQNSALAAKETYRTVVL